MTARGAAPPELQEAVARLEAAANMYPDLADDIATVIEPLACHECDGDGLHDPPCPICGGTGIDTRDVRAALAEAQRERDEALVSVAALSAGLLECQRERDAALAAVKVLRAEVEAGRALHDERDKVQQPYAYGHTAYVYQRERAATDASGVLAATATTTTPEGA